MYIYKIVFARKTIISCKQLDGLVEMSGKYFCEHRNGEPIYAIVKADSEVEAYKVAQVLVADMTEKIFGRDYII
jgi:hypothetical protein